MTFLIRFSFVTATTMSTSAEGEGRTIELFDQSTLAAGIPADEEAKARLQCDLPKGIDALSPAKDHRNAI